MSNLALSDRCLITQEGRSPALDIQDGVWAKIYQKGSHKNRIHLTSLNSGPLLAIFVISTIGFASLAFYEATNRTPATVTTSSPYCLALSCDSLSVGFQMTAAIASNGSILFAGVITNNGRDPATGMRILANGTNFPAGGAYWTTTYSPGFPSPGAPLAPGSSVSFHARLGAGAPREWPVVCQSFPCSAGDKLLIEVDLFGSNTNLADSDVYITIGTE
jgi:hypothetical protein